MHSRPVDVAMNQLYDASKLVALAAVNLRKDMTIPQALASVSAVVADNIGTMLLNLYDRVRHYDSTPGRASVWELRDRNRPKPAAELPLYRTLEAAQAFVEEQCPGGTWNQSNAHGVVWYYLPGEYAGLSHQAQQQGRAHYMFCIIEKEVQ